jgi:hypothetical protein
MRIYILETLLICSLINACFELDIGIRDQLAWSAEKFLTGEFTNNLGSHCNLVAKDGKITGEYFTKPSRGKLIQPGFPVTGVYTPVKDGALLTMIVTYKMEGESSNGLERFSQAAWNGKVYASRKDFKMNWLLNSNVNKEDEWSATNLGQDHFIKLK